MDLEEIAALTITSPSRITVIFPGYATRTNPNAGITPEPKVPKINFLIRHETLGITASDSRYMLVKSLYGPGTVWCWFLVTCSVLISWTLNPRQRKRDRLTNDFIACLTYPCIASAHLAFLLARLPSPLLNVLMSTETEMFQQAAAVAAPLSVCETFSLFAFVLYTITAWRLPIKRSILVLVVGLLSWTMVDGVFLSTKAKNTERIPFNENYGSINSEGIMELGFVIAIMFFVVPFLFLVVVAGAGITLWLKPASLISGNSTFVALVISILLATGILLRRKHDTFIRRICFLFQRQV
jgi:hypothetical protein